MKVVLYLVLLGIGIGTWFVAETIYYAIKHPYYPYDTYAEYVKAYQEKERKKNDKRRNT